MQSFDQTNKFSFGLVALAVLVTAGFALGVSLPLIQTAQFNQVDKLLELSNNSEDQNLSQTYLKQASILGFNDPLPVERLASLYWQRGEYGKSIATYQSSWLQINKLYLGNQALKASRPSLAKIFYNEANIENESAESQAGLAKVAFVENRVGEGCNHADRAKKLNLSSPSAIQAVEVCAAMTNTSALPERARATLLINNYIFEAGLTKLEASATKSTSDWLLISEVYANKGEFDKAIVATKNGLLQDPSNQELLKLMTKLETASGKNSDETYQNRVEDLEFTNFQWLSQENSQHKSISILFALVSYL